MSINPPKKRDWTKGKYQVGLFIRFPDGVVVELTCRHIDAKERDGALALLALLVRPGDKRGDAV